ncbi:MAG: hypothetical protein F6K25_01265 [Okeania sp. SIO2G4]|uniref:hypothetical protein n=1 Tax=unclassified Okeania TaxID=2634635 RepID=UPI0013B728C3|nr:MULTISPECIES: hypothetical protein [unclassified Okeania]NEP07767.1 hypothetical protein [Okeania sp. SIO4D6]NEP41024.1 hypothetical protein [Okeania sp. SIO2H7]NEP71330.1 hypothetical protein [Okeania sp. SIO2G5]NEP91976.1 hypothetical protein [Okeania sp. SIO2F5]NEQ89453.1 hypothetical protein [Okeania sp. SIO2G4]
MKAKTKIGLVTDDSQKLVYLILEPLIEVDVIAFQALLVQENIKKRDLLRLKNGSVIEYYLPKNCGLKPPLLRG